MRRIIFAWGLLLVGFVCIAQSEGVSAFWQSRDSNYNVAIVSGFTPSCSQSSAWLARATNVTLTADKQAYDTMICGMVTDGDWALLDALYIFAAPDSTTAALSLVSSTFNATVHGTSGGFTAYQGWTGSSGGSFFLDTTAVAGALTNYTRNSAAFGLYDRTSRTTQTADFEACENPGNDDQCAGLLYAFGGGGLTYAVSSSTGVSGLTNANAQGQYVFKRTGASATAAYKNSSGTAFHTDTDASAALSVAFTFYVFAQNNGGVAGAFSSDQLAAYWFGGGGVNPANIMTRINTYMTTQGTNVY